MSNNPFLSSLPVCGVAAKRVSVQRPTHTAESSESKASDPAANAAAQKSNGMAVQIVGEAPTDKEKDQRHFQTVEERIAVAQNFLENSIAISIGESDDLDTQVQHALPSELNAARSKVVVRMNKSKAAGARSLAVGSSVSIKAGESGTADFDCALHPDEVDDRLKANLSKADEARQRPITAPARPATSWYPNDVAQNPRSAILGDELLGHIS
jgi:hypothetical protein